MSHRYDRQIRFFGAEGQRRIVAAHVVILGCGGLGMHVVQQLSYLGVRRWTLVDPDAVDETNLNRLIGAGPDDIGTLKTVIAERLIRSLHPEASVASHVGRVGDVGLEASLRPALADSDLVVGCFDKETPRLVANEQSAAAGVPYLDIATDISTGQGAERETLIYGGRVVLAHDGSGCVSCLGVLDQQELARERMTPVQRDEHDKIYGVDHAELEGSGPSVVTLNGVVASLGCTEAMVLLTGLREPARQLTYRADRGMVTRNTSIGNAGCAFCRSRRA